MEVRVGKKLAMKKKCSKVSSQKGLTVVQCWLTYGKEVSEKRLIIQPILWTEQPTGVVMGAGSLWPPVCGCHEQHPIVWKKTTLCCSESRRGLKPGQPSEQSMYSQFSPQLVTTMVSFRCLNPSISYLPSIWLKPIYHLFLLVSCKFHHLLFFHFAYW
jgi:hypothetical protein